jgi:hypothetical protein
MFSFSGTPWCWASHWNYHTWASSPRTRSKVMGFSFTVHWVCTLLCIKSSLSALSYLSLCLSKWYCSDDCFVTALCLRFGICHICQKGFNSRLVGMIIQFDARSSDLGVPISYPCSCFSFVYAWQTWMLVGVYLIYVKLARWHTNICRKSSTFWSMLSSLLSLSSAHCTVGECVDVDYDCVITKQSYYQQMLPVLPLPLGACPHWGLLLCLLAWSLPRRCPEEGVAWTCATVPCERYISPHVVVL